MHKNRYTTNKLSTQNGWNSLERDREEEEEGDLERKEQ